jgi:membrane-bound lytic murein transglycosylase B
MYRSIILFSLVVLASCSSSSTEAEREASSNGYEDRPEVAVFISEMAEEGFDPEELKSLFAAAKYQQSIVDAISRPAERTLNWASYQDIFLTERRAKAGAEFVAENLQAFQRAEAEYGVPIPVIASIIGVETLYGRITGKYRVIDSLSTLAFDYPPRSKFFRSELKEFLRLTREEKKSPLDPLGSYAGAMGYGQFISSSYRNYAVDFDGDGLRDIWNNRVDAIGSVANYLARHGWQAGDGITERVSLTGEEPADVFNVALKPNRSIASLSTVGVLVPPSLAQDVQVSPMRLEGKNGDEYWLGLNNFYVITRYNHSKLYAMAVFQLSERIKATLAS